MGDLRSGPWIVAKGALLLGVAALSSALLLLESPTARTALLLALAIWAACRFYYFLFYVLERYVDRDLRYAGLIGLLRAIRAKRA